MEIKEIIQGNWPIKVESIDILKKSGERIVYKITSDKSSFIFKVADHSKNKDDVINDTSIFQFLKENDFPAPRIIKASTQENFVKVEGKYIYALTFLDGKTPEATVDNYRKLGELTAKLHNIKGYKRRTKFTVESEKSNFAENGKNFGKKYSDLVNSLPSFAGYPECLIHSDIGLHNTVQLKNGDIVLVDWDDAGIGARVLDIGFPLLNAFVTEDLKYRTKEARAYYGAYFSGITLAKIEIEHIWDAGLFFALMYFPVNNGQADWRKTDFALKNKDLIVSSYLS